MIHSKSELNQFQRSKDRLNEILYHFMTNKNEDDQTFSYLRVLEMSIKKLDNKIEEFNSWRLEIGG